jgi:hypothetical protein
MNVVLMPYVVARDLSCLLCSRTAATVCNVEGRAVVRLARPDYADSVLALRCPECSGRLMHGERREAGIRMTAEQFHALPTNAGRRGPAAASDIPCPDCQHTMIRPSSARCRECSARHRESKALQCRVVAALQAGAPYAIDDLCRRLGTTPYSIGHAVRNARKDGHPIIRRGGVLSLGVQR